MLRLMRALVFGFVWCFWLYAMEVQAYGLWFFLSLIPAFILFEIIEGIFFYEPIKKKGEDDETY